MTGWHYIICVVVGVVVYCFCHFGQKLLHGVDKVIREFVDRWRLVLVTALALTTVAAGPRIENWHAWTESNGCKFATFTLSDDGERGNYYLTCNSPEFPQFYLPADMWVAVTRIEYVGAASYRVALYTNFSCATFRMEKIQ